MNLCNIAEQNGIKGVFLYSRTEVYNALRQAIEKISAYLHETERAEMLRAIVDYANSGIIGTDRDFHITTFNPAAEKILGLKAMNIIGKPFQDIFPGFALPKMYNEATPRINEIGTFGPKRFIYHSLPINVKGRTHGQVTVLHDMASIRTAEAKIRRDLLQKRFMAQYHFV